jgi:predicted RNA methylase
MRIPPVILTTLQERAHTDGRHLTLTGPRFTPTLYRQINDILEAVGGRWTPSVGAHVFPVDADQALADIYATGEIITLREKRQQAQYFPTPTPVVDRLLALAGLEPSMRLLEPSAGSGAIAGAARTAGAAVDCIERDTAYAGVLVEAGHSVRVADFLAVPAEPVYDRVVMNPPFTRGTDMAHVEHALRFLKPDGLLVSVMSWTVAEHTRATAKFRALVEARGGTVEAVAERAFAESGTDVPTVIVAIPAVRNPDASATVWPVRQAPREQAPEFGDPLQIANEIRASLRSALFAFDAVAASLARPAVSERRPAEVVALPKPCEEQLSIDLDATA